MSLVTFRLPLVLVLLVSGAALAFNYRVDTEGGDAALAEEVEAAVAAWSEGDTPIATPAEDARNVIAYGRADRFGPDLQSLTLASGSGEEREVRVLINPGLENRAPVLAHQIGVLAGLPEAETGVMNPRLTPDSPTEPDAAALEALAALAETVPEDINRDGVVDFYDLIALARAFGQTGVNLPADINEDGVVDEADLALLEAAYTFTPPAETPPAPEATPPGEEGLPPVPDPAGALDGTGEPEDFDPQAPDTGFDEFDDPADEFDDPDTGFEDDFFDDEFFDDFEDEFDEP